MSQRVEPIRRSVTVSCAQEHAFLVFTERMDSWWPIETHSRAAIDREGEGVKTDRIELQGRVGGQVIEHVSDGTSLPWGEIIAWDPPRRMVLAWRPHSRPQPPTEVEVTFTPRGGGTLVELEHRGWERLSEDYSELYGSYAGSWVATLGRFAAVADAA